MKAERLKLSRPETLWLVALVSSGINLKAAEPAFNDANWTSLGSGMNGSVRALALSGTNLYAAGIFTTAGNSNAHYVAKWNGSTWSAMGSGMNGYYVNALAVVGTSLYAGGNFSMAGFSTTYNVAVWNGTSWSGLGFGTGLDNTVYSLAVSGNNLYAGGEFTRADSSTTVNSIAKWNGSSWSALGSGMGGTDLNSVYAIVIAGTGLYASGLFTTAGNSSAGDLAIWNGSSWSSPGWFGAGTNYYPSVYALALSSSDLYAGGDFTSASGIPANHIAKRTGTNWLALGSGLNGTVRALAVSGDDLYVGGDFTTAGNKSSPYIAHAYLPALPTLSIAQSAGDITISWPSTNLGFVLEQSPSLAQPITWLPNAATISDDGTNASVTLSATNSLQLFRLRRP